MRLNRRKLYGNYRAAPKLAEDHLQSLGEKPPVSRIEEVKVPSNAISPVNPPPHVLFRCRLTVGTSTGRIKSFAVESPLRSSAILAYQHAAYYLCVRFGIDSNLKLPVSPPKPKAGKKKKARWTAAQRAARKAEKAVTAPPPEVPPEAALEDQATRGDNTDEMPIEDEDYAYSGREGAVFMDPDGAEFTGLWGGALSDVDDDGTQYPIRTSSPLYFPPNADRDAYMIALVRNRVAAWEDLGGSAGFGAAADDTGVGAAREDAVGEQA
ncbi:uncharacterized protein LOC62_04G006186 [Vanrija pseudolonga]|uniref:Uncharacterized protein n=1 Tax=Vanrija pseudolonga TaxID=143232 RepID=A0AAF0YA30_9TREE|nr:hypothetical protein LOC62_04G006186 [Vanrija pseudolonga]